MEYIDKNAPEFSYRLLRYTLLPELLGNDEADILYWGGKTIARKFPVENQEEMIDFFRVAGWGELRLVKKKKRELHFELDIPAGEEEPLDRHLEAGFIAEQMERQEGRPAETYIWKKSKRITFQVQWEK